MVKESERLGRIVDDLLDLSLIETQEAPRREPVPVSVLIEDAADRVRRAATPRRSASSSTTPRRARSWRAIVASS